MTLTIARLGHLGDGIAETAAGPVFVPFTLPGEVVEGEIDGDRLAAPKVVTPSALRVKAPCPHFRTCGGCALQHAADGFVAEWKAGIVAGALKGQGLEARVLPTLTSGASTRRRATTTTVPRSASPSNCADRPRVTPVGLARVISFP